MINTVLKQTLSEIISNEIYKAIVFTDTMSDAHITGYNGFKRFFRYMARDNLEHAIRLKNKIVDYCDINPDIKLSYTTPTLASNGSNMTIEAFLVNSKGLYMSNLEKLRAGAKLAIENNEDKLMGILEEYICDEEYELKKINRIIKEWTNAKKYGDASYLDRKDKILHGKYKCKEDKNGYKY